MAPFSEGKDTKVAAQSLTACASPLGPSVTPTASASLLMPACILCRDSLSKMMSFAWALTCREGWAPVISQTGRCSSICYRVASYSGTASMEEELYHMQPLPMPLSSELCACCQWPAKVLLCAPAQSRWHLLHQHVNTSSCHA